MENNLSNLLFITVEDVKESKLWQPINDRKQSACNDNLIYNAILKTSLWMDRLSGGTISDKINKKDLFPWVKKDNTGLIEYDKWLSYIQSACLLAVINWYLPKGVNDLTGSASFSQGGVAYSQTNDPEANENITRDVKNALKLAGEIIDIISSKTVSRPYNYHLGNYSHPWEEEYKYITKKTFYPTLLFWLKERLQTDGSINITYPIINDFSKIDYNEYIKLIVPFDNNTIYYEDNFWKAKQSGDIPSYGIKDSDLNKDYIDKQDDKYIVKTSQDIILKQDKLVSGENIKTINGNSLLGNGDISISVGNDWEFVDTSDFKPATEYQIKDFDSSKFKYKIWCQFSILPYMFVETFKDFDIGCGIVVSYSKGVSGWYIDTNGLISSYDNVNIVNLKIERKLVS
ncbi:hypothetical protein [Spiroplasma poulsonii]|uniref:Uncharacterized protein n=1 Tax=Spiroplasma poulsonii TaxID=2138 RepID=A0A2P6FFB6_9MOLU|nr:hypothetical protein [Spiroplasma poulsonii]PQM32143.1 hypothetical protein SMSRO_SF020430 [Spiroplasma poulsonii]PWF94788.1 hypothetical protein SMSE_02120 [Spiroplasma poulsonii]PWF97586.1 hypothetical protein SMH99_01350 [Spiroplasma poulsonii]